MRVFFCSRKLLVAAFQDGWRLIPGHDYRPDDWAILMMLPEVPEPMSAAEIQTASAQFRRPATGHLNKAAAATSRNIALGLARRKLETA